MARARRTVPGRAEEIATLPASAIHRRRDLGLSNGGSVCDSRRQRQSGCCCRASSASTVSRRQERREPALGAGRRPAARARHRHHIQAQMDLGATVCSRANPPAGDARWRRYGVARRDGRIGEPCPRRGRARRCASAARALRVILTGDAGTARASPAERYLGRLAGAAEIPEDDDPTSWACATLWSRHCRAPSAHPLERIHPLRARNRAPTDARHRRGAGQCRRYRCGRRWTASPMLRCPMPVRRILEALLL